MFFIGLGGQKCGSTWLFHYLCERTDAGLLPIKELSWFNETTGKTSGFNLHFRQHAERILASLASRQAPPSERQLYVIKRANILSNSDYRNLFVSRFDVEHQTCGEISPIYGLLDTDGFREIDGLFPGVCFFLICRNPADRYWSGLSWHANKRGAAFDIQSECLNQLARSDFSRLTEYDSIVRNAALAVGRERLFLAFYEDLFSPKGPEVLKSLCSFLRVSYGEPDMTKVVLGGEYPPIEPDLRQKVVRRFSKTYEWAMRNIGELPVSWKRDLASISRIPDNLRVCPETSGRIA